MTHQRLSAQFLAPYKPNEWEDWLHMDHDYLEWTGALVPLCPADKSCPLAGGHAVPIQEPCNFGPTPEMQRCLHHIQCTPPNATLPAPHTHHQIQRLHH